MNGLINQKQKWLIKWSNNKESNWVKDYINKQGKGRKHEWKNEWVNPRN